MLLFSKLHSRNFLGSLSYVDFLSKKFATSSDGRGIAISSVSPGSLCIDI